MSRVLTLVLNDKQAENLELEAEASGFSVAKFLEVLIEKHLNSPFEQNEMLMSFLLATSMEGAKHGLKYGPIDVAARLCIDWIAGATFESSKFGKAVSRAPILAGPSDLKELYRECFARYVEIHKVGVSFAEQERKPKDAH